MHRLTLIAAAAILLSAPATTAAAATPSAVAGSWVGPTPSQIRVREVPITPTASGRAAPAVIAPVVGLSGRGFGHGRGMSQWGARGAASQGRTAEQILAFYYPGTASANIGNPDVRVRLTAMSSGPTVVAGEPGLTLTDGSCTATLSPATATSWRTVRSGGWKVEAYFTTSSGSTGWWPVTTSCPGFTTAKALTFVGDGSLANSVLTLRTPTGNRQYRGGLRATPVTLRGGATVLTYGTVNVLSMNNYLRSVVPAEMPASWGLEAVKAQAVAARSYAAKRLGSPDGFDICDTTSCQVYPGLTSSNPEHPNSDAAVAGTTGLVRKYGTVIANTEFGSTNGGQIVGSSVAYQVAKADPYDGVYEAAPDTWSYNVPVSVLERAWPTIGTFRSMTISRDAKGAWFGGRGTTITLSGTSGTQSVGAETFRSILNLRSTWFIPIGSSVGTDFAGNGFSDLIARDASGNLWNYPTDGRGAFLARTLIATGWPAAPEILAPGDFSGDGIPDLLSRSTTTGALTVHRGSGTGKIASSAVVASGWQGFTTVIAPGDLDGDGAVDLLARDSAGVLWLYPGTGKGAFKPRVSKGSGWGGYAELEAVGDFDRDGGTDLMAKNTAGTLTLLRFSAAGAYLGAKALSTGFQTYTSFTGLGDVNGDGFVDLVARDGTGALWTFRGTGTGVLRTWPALGSGWSAMTVGS